MALPRLTSEILSQSGKAQASPSRFLIRYETGLTRVLKDQETCGMSRSSLAALQARIGVFKKGRTIGSILWYDMP